MSRSKCDDMAATLVSIKPVTGFEPHRTSSMTMYTQSRPEGEDPRSLAPVTKFHLGPGTKVIGGNLLYAYEERPYTNMVTTSSQSDAQQLLKATKNLQTTKPAGTLTASGRQQETSTSAPEANGKVVYWDGKGHHVMDAPPAGVAWSAPHLGHDDITAGGSNNVGTRQVAGTDNMMLIGGTHRYVRPGEVTGQNPRTASLAFGTGPADPPATIRQYSVTKAIGHAEYEKAVQSLGGLATWSATQQDLRSHVQVCHPARIMAPAEHSATGLATLRASQRL